MTDSPRSSRRTPSPQTPHGGAWLFDPQDFELLRIVNDVLERGPHAGWKKLLAPYLHPNGIKEMATSFGLRLAYAVVNVLGSLETGRAYERLEALRSLREEILTAPQSSLRYNTSRVLLQIMKELVRSRGDELKQLRLAHDFRRCVSGKPRIVRAQLAKYQLLEMHEDYKQLAFDDHVHDAYSKGRKTPSHLVMDAWIKGLRKINLIYYNYIPADVAWEVLHAAEIMDVSVRISIELRARHLGRSVKLLWTPRGMAAPEDFVGFLQTAPVQEFMNKGREVSAFQQQYVWRLLEKYNQELRFALAREEGVEAPPLAAEAFAAFLGPGQASVDQLAIYLAEQLQSTKGEGPDSDALLARWLAPEVNPDLPDPFNPGDYDEVPELLRLSPAELVARLGEIHYHNWITLDPEGLDRADLVLVLHACEGAVTHLEAFNLRSYTGGRRDLHRQVLELQETLNAGNAVRCKRYLHRLIVELGQEPDQELGQEPDQEPGQEPGRKSGQERTEKLLRLTELLEHLHEFYRLYRKRPLRLRVGTDSTGKSAYRHGMGIVVAETLPPRARKQLRKSRDERFMPLPLCLGVMQQVTYRPRMPHGPLASLLQRLPGGYRLASEKVRCWVKGDYGLCRGRSNCLYGLGGKVNQPPVEESHTPWSLGGLGLQWLYLNSKLQNGLKILFGLLPAALSFYLTKDWWLLAWFGAVIWFTITGVRNIIQSVLGCGGLRRSHLLKWRDLVSWDRFADSLLFTGFSVPLLDWLVKSVVLDQGLGITTGTQPVLLYAVMALVNGAYISGHNLFRGLPRSAVAANFFRSFLSFPLALLINSLLAQLLAAKGVPGSEAILQNWAAVISKLASDMVAGVIEGLADRGKYIALRRRDLEQKLKQLYDTHAQLEMLYPQDDVVELLEMPKAFIETLSTEQRGLEQIVIVNALDCMYLWLYQPRGRTVLTAMLRGMTPDERKIFLLSQYVLQREKEISLMLVNGLVGKHFAQALAFYLNNAQDYLEQIQRAALRV